jgi:phosphopantothenoylcysteine decarboxylase/phosphopantothenate--cysteine ligase
MTDAPRKIVLGISGGIAAYKTAELIRAFKKSGCEVQVAMTAEAARFVTPLTLGTLSQRPVLTEIFATDSEGSWTRHVELGLWADIVVIAPATANTIAKLAHGVCDSMLLAIALSARCPVLVCPAMDHDMYLHPATQKNLADLQSFGYHVLPPEHGELASGLTGWGRLPDLESIQDRVDEILETPAPPMDLEGRSVLVTAGPTRERIDPVRFISNHSTGTMGFALAAAAAERGARVTLVSGPSARATPRTVDRIDVESAAEMAEAVFAHADADVIIMAAAVADYRPSNVSDSKIKKGRESLGIELERTTDILATLGASKRDGQILVGFAMETGDGEQNARKKLVEKNLDWIVLNDLNDPGAGFGTSTNKVSVFGADGSVQHFPTQSKSTLATGLLSVVCAAEGSD